jgi:hypothetical protein
MPNLIETLYENHLTLRLLAANNAPLVLGFFYEVFKERNLQNVGEEELELLLVNHLAGSRLEDNETKLAPDQRARNYLNLWCRDMHGYLRKVYSEEEECFVYQLTRHSEKALQWLRELQTGEKHGHMTTESRFTRIFNEFKTLSRQTKADSREREKDLLAQRDEIDAEIARIRETGQVDTLTSSQVKDRLIDLEQMIEAFLSDFRAIEDHFKEQAAEIHEIYLERGRSKGDIVEHALDADQALRNSEQGKSYYGFRSLIRSMESREELTQLVEDAARLAIKSGTDEAVFSSLMERLLDRVMVVQGSYQRIATQLRRVVEETNAQDTRRLLESISAIKQAAMALRTNPPEGEFAEIDEAVAWANLMEMSFHEKRESPHFDDISPPGSEDDADLAAVVRQIGKPLDLEGYREKVARLLETHNQIALRQVLEAHPASEGAIDLVGYLCIAADDPRHLIDDTSIEEIDLNRPQQPRFATINRIIYQNS